MSVGAAAALVAGLIGAGLIVLPNVERLVEDIGAALGPWTYLFVGVMAFLETGAFVGLVAPGETTVIVGGVVAGQGEIALLTLIAIVWACAVLGDVTSYLLGRRLGRGFLVRHGARVKITEERLEQVEGFFARRGGMTILIGRFIGLVRAIAPFIAGASRMPLAKFLPYDILGAGAWATTFCVLGYVFWRSFDRLTEWVSRGLFAFGALVALGVSVWFCLRLIHDPALRRRAGSWIDDQLDRSWLRPAAPYVRGAWERALRPLLRRAERPFRFLWGRLTPGELGLELTTLLALAAVGSFTFALLGEALDDATLLPFDRPASRLAERLRTDALEAALVGLTTLGSFVATGLVTCATAIWAASRRRVAEAIALPVAFLAIVVAVDVAKATFDRPRPAAPLVDTAGSAYPSGHAAYSIAWVACAVVLARGGSSIASRFAIVTLAVVLALAIGLTRVYLRAHHLSDVLGGWGLGATVFAVGAMLALVVSFLRQNERPG